MVGCGGSRSATPYARRRRDARGRALLLDGAPGDSEPAVALDVRTALLTLPPRQPAVIALYYLDDQPVAEIVALLGCSAGTVKTHLALAGRRWRCSSERKSLMSFDDRLRDELRRATESHPLDTDDALRGVRARAPRHLLPQQRPADWSRSRSKR